MAGVRVLLVALLAAVALANQFTLPDTFGYLTYVKKDCSVRPTTWNDPTYKTQRGTFQVTYTIGVQRPAQVSFVTFGTAPYMSTAARQPWALVYQTDQVSIYEFYYQMTPTSSAPPDSGSAGYFVSILLGCEAGIACQDPPYNFQTVQRWFPYNITTSDCPFAVAYNESCAIDASLSLAGTSTPVIIIDYAATAAMTDLHYSVSCANYMPASTTLDRVTAFIFDDFPSVTLFADSAYHGEHVTSSWSDGMGIDTHALIMDIRSANAAEFDQRVQQDSATLTFVIELTVPPPVDYLRRRSARDVSVAAALTGEGDSPVAAPAAAAGDAGDADGKVAGEAVKSTLSVPLLALQAGDAAHASTAYRVGGRVTKARVRALQH